MTKAKSMGKNIEEIRNALKKNNLVIGSKQTIKMLKQSKIEKVFLTTNCPEQVREDIENYSKINKVELVNLSYPNDELGVFCKKQYSISVVGIPKGA